jgi:hypothetical protein
MFAVSVMAENVFRILPFWEARFMDISYVTQAENRRLRERIAGLERMLAGELAHQGTFGNPKDFDVNK